MNHGDDSGTDFLNTRSSLYTIICLQAVGPCSFSSITLLLKNSLEVNVAATIEVPGYWFCSDATNDHSFKCPFITTGDDDVTGDEYFLAKSPVTSPSRMQPSHCPSIDIFYPIAGFLRPFFATNGDVKRTSDLGGQISKSEASTRSNATQIKAMPRAKPMPKPNNKIEGDKNKKRIAIGPSPRVNIFFRKMPPRLYKPQIGKKSSSPESEDEKPFISRFLQMKRQPYDNEETHADFTSGSRVGPAYQTMTPDYFGPNPTEPSTHKGKTMWIPQATEETIEEVYRTFGQDQLVPRYDDEEVLHALYSNGYCVPTRIEEIEEHGLVNPPKRTINNPRRTFSAAEVDEFEEGLMMFGKNFFNIRKRYLPKHTVGELIEFYYTWKKSGRYDRFVAQLSECGEIMDGEIMKLTGLKKMDR
uniref:SANT domain-containing protein n=1 Tax=Steinernema glaseri TaxID=37863 RepID=A0A1I7Z1X7_9BILA